MKYFAHVFDDTDGGKEGLVSLEREGKGPALPGKEEKGLRRFIKFCSLLLLRHSCAFKQSPSQSL